MISASRWATLWAIFYCFINCAGKSHETLSTNHHTMKRKVSGSGESNRGPSAYQPSALTTRPSRLTPFCQNGSHISREPPWLIALWFASGDMERPSTYVHVFPQVYALTHLPWPKAAVTTTVLACRVVETPIVLSSFANRVWGLCFPWFARSWRAE